MAAGPVHNVHFLSYAMPDIFSPVDIVLDASTRSRRVIVGSTLAVPDANQGLDLYYGGQYLFMAKVCKGSPSTPYSFTPGTAFLWGADDTHIAGADPVVSMNDQFHVAGDWAFDPGAGLLCWRANLATAELLALMTSTTNPSILLKACLWAIPPTGSYVLVAAWDMTVWMPAVNPTTAVAVAGFTHLTTVDAAATYVPIWGSGAFERRKNGRTQFLFPDGKWRAAIPVMVDGQPALTWGTPEDS